MASIARDPNGRKRILFVGADGKRRPIRLGKVSMKEAAVFKIRVERLVSAAIIGHSPDDETSRWLSRLDDTMRKRLAAVGLATERQSLSLGEWLDKYVDGRTDLKHESQRKLSQTKDKLLGFFNRATPLRSIGPAAAADWQEWITKAGLAEATVKTHGGNARGIFEEAVRRKLIAENPSEYLRSGSTATENERFVTADETEAVLGACPSVEWRLLFGLARLAGLRVPSETELLTWADVDWSRGRLHVRSPKTEHHRGHERRVVPIMPRLMELLQDRFDEAEPGEERLFRIRPAGGYTRKVFDRVVQEAGVEPWAGLFQTLRSSCEQQWAMTFPQYAVSLWIGHSITVSGKHYNNFVPDELFDKAAGGEMAKAAHNRAQHGAESGCTGPNATLQKIPVEAGNSPVCDAMQPSTTIFPNGGGGIRTPGAGFPAQRFSRPSP